MIDSHFPRSQKYNPEWVTSSASGGANALLLTEWLTTAMDLQPGMRVLDLGCGRGVSSIFLHREYNVEVWSTDLWFDPSERLQLITGAQAEKHVYPIHADARNLPFAKDFFDAVVAIDSYPYYGTDDHYLNYLARFVKPGGVIGIAGAGLMQEFDGAVPQHLKAWWEPGMCSFHSAAWWRRHWERTGIVDIELADSMADGWRLWLEWHRSIAPDNITEIEAVESDQGTHLGYVRVIARRRADAKLEDPITAVPPAPPGTRYPNPYA